MKIRIQCSIPLKLQLIYLFVLIGLLSWNCDRPEKATKNKHSRNEQIFLEKPISVSGLFLNENKELPQSTIKIETSIGYLRGLCIDSQDNLYAIDVSAKKIVSFDANGYFRFSFLENGQGPGEMLLPWCMQIYNDTLYISDRNLHKIDVFTLRGRFLREIYFENSDVQSFALSLADREFIALSYSDEHVLRIDDASGLHRQDFLSRAILTEGRDYFETNQFIMHFVQNTQTLFLAQVFLGKIYVIDYKKKAFLRKLDFMDGDSIDFNLSYISAQRNMLFKGKNNRLIRAYYILLEHASVRGSNIIYTFYCKGKASTLLGVMVNAQTLDRTLILSNNSIDRIEALVPLHHSKSVFLNLADANLLEKWSIGNGSVSF